MLPAAAYAFDQLDGGAETIEACIGFVDGGVETRAFGLMRSL